MFWLSLGLGHTGGDIKPARSLRAARLSTESTYSAAPGRELVHVMHFLELLVPTGCRAYDEAQM